LLLGCGYTAKALIPSLKVAGFEIYGTTRSEDKADGLAALGVRPLQYAGAISKELRKVLANCTHLVSSIAPNPKGDPFVQSIKNHFGKNWAKALPNLEWAAYLSATSVYGDRNGQWVFEEELLHPTTQRGRARVSGELDWMESGLPVHIFRIAGIYGPGRNALKRIKNGGVRAVIKEGHVSNRIHVDDIASALMASIAHPHPLAIYNLADDHPAPPQDILRFGAKLLGAKKAEEVQFEKAEMSEMARSFYLEARRTSNALAKQELGWAPKYPSYKEGLAAILKSGI
jgi:nucleoside-diphosphate-sugar epimerase